MAGITQNDEERIVNMDGNAVNISTELHACGTEGRSAAFEHEGVNSRVSMDDAINLYWIVRSVDGNKILEQIERTTMEVKEMR